MSIDRFVSRLSLGVVLLVLLMASAQAATRYVAPTGNDAGNSCLNFGAPCLTIGHAVAEANAGDSILAATGAYAETVSVNKSLTISGPDATLSGAIRLAVNGITINDITISGGATVLGEVAGLYLDGGTSGHLISDVTLTGTGTPGARGILFGAGVSNVSVSGSTIDGWSSAIYLNPSLDANISISGNVISNNFAGVAGDDYSDVTISNNDFIDNNEAIGYSGDADGPTITANNFDGNGVIVQTYFGAELDLEQIAIDNGLTVSVINSTQGGLFTELQAAIDAASDGDTLVASAGTFTEDLVITNKTGLTLLGAQAGVSAGVDGVRNAGSTVDESIIVGTFSFGGGSPTTFDLSIDGFRLEQTSMAGARIGGELNLANLVVDSVTSTYFVSTVGTFTAHQLVLTDSTISGARGFSVENAQLTSASISNNIFNQPAASLVSASALDGALTLSGNVFNGPRGVNILSNGNVLADNVFNVGGGQRAIDLYEVTANAITGNLFNADDSVGILVLAGGRGEAVLNNDISDNQFLGSNATGINNTLAKDVDASCNWWGAQTGPGGDADGDGSAVIGQVDFTPWNLASEGNCSGGVDGFVTSLVGFASAYPVGSSENGSEQITFDYTDNFGGTQAVFNVFTVLQGGVEIAPATYGELFESVSFSPNQVRGLSGTDSEVITAPEDLATVAVSFTLQPDAPQGSYTLRLASFDVSGIDANDVSLAAASAGDYAVLDSDQLDINVVSALDGYRVVYDFSDSAQLTAIGPQNAGDPLVPRAYPSTSSQPFTDVAGGVLTLGTSNDSPVAGEGTLRVAGLRPQLENVGSSTRLDFDFYMNNPANRPYMQTRFRNISGDNDGRFAFQAINDDGFFFIEIDESEVVRILAPGEATATDFPVSFDNSGWNRLRIQMEDDGRALFLLNGRIFHETDAGNVLFADPDSGNLTLEVREVNADGSPGNASVELASFEYGIFAEPDLGFALSAGLPAGPIPADEGWSHFTANLSNDGAEVFENVVLWVDVDGIDDTDVAAGLSLQLFNGSEWQDLGWGGASNWNIGREDWFLGRGPGQIVGFEISEGSAETIPLRVNWPNGEYSATITIESLDSESGAPGERIYLTQVENVLVRTEPVDMVYVDSAFAGATIGDGLVFTLPDGTPVNVTYGLDAYDDIYDGLNVVGVDGQVQVASGDFFELVEGLPLELNSEGVTLTTDPADPATLRYGFTDFFPVIEVFAENTTVEHFNLVRDNGADASQAIAIRKAGSTVQNLTITGSNNANIAAITLDHGVPGSYDSDVDNVLITGNNISGSFGWGFGVATRSADAAILDATITNNVIDGTVGGIFFFNSGGTVDGIQNISYTGNSHLNLTGNTLLFQSFEVLDPEQFLASNVTGQWARVVDGDNINLRIQPAINSAGAGDTVLVSAGSFVETLVIDKPLSLLGDPSGADRPVITWSDSVAAGAETLVRVRAEDVTIDGFELVVDQTFIGEAIRTEGDAAGLVVRNNRIEAAASDPDNIVGFGIRNAIAVNPIGRPDNVGSGFGPVLVENNQIVANPTGVGIGGFFRAGLVMDTAHGALLGNDIQAITHDAIIRFVLGGEIVVDDNDFRGAGVQLTEFNPTGPVTISDNRFVPDAGLVAAFAGGQSSLRLQNNPNAIVTTVTGNDFNGHSTAIRLENYPAASIVGNGFVPVADMGYQHVVVSNRVNASNFIAPLEVDVAIDGNAFFGGGEPGVALVFDNLNCCDDVGSGNTTASFGQLRVGGASPNEFDGTLSQYIVLDDTSALVSFGLAETQAQPFFADVNAIGNIFDGVAGADQNETQRAATRARIVDSRVNGDLGDVILDFIGATVEGTTSVQGIGAPVLAVAGVNVAGLQDGVEANSVQSGAGGAYSLPELPEGDVDVAASLAGFATVAQSVTLTEGGMATSVDFLLDSSVSAAFAAAAGGAPLNGQSFFAARDVADVDLAVSRNDGGPDVDFFASLTVFDSQGNEIDYINDGLFSMDTLIALDGLLGEGNNFTLGGSDSVDLLSGVTLEIGPNADQLDVVTLSFRLIDGRFGASGSRIVHAASNFAVTIEPAPSVSLQGLDTSTLTAEFSVPVVSTASGYAGLTPAQVAATAVDAASKENFLLTYFDFNAAELALISDWTAVMIDGTDTELSLSFGPGLFELSYALDLGNTGASRIDAAWAGTDQFETVAGSHPLDGPVESDFKLEFTVPYSDTTGVDYAAALTTTFIDATKPLLRPFAPGIESGTSTDDPVAINYAVGSYATGLVAEYSLNGGAPVSYNSGDALTASGDYELTVTNVSNPRVAAGASTTIRFTIEAGLVLTIDGPALAPLAEPVFFSVTLENPATTEPGENVEAGFSVSRPGIAAGDVLVEYCLDSAAAGTPGNCADWIMLNLVEDNGSLVGSYGPAGGFPVDAGYEATTFFRASFNEAGNYDTVASVTGADSGDVLASDELVITVTELQFEIESGVPADVDDSESGFAYYTADLINLGDELPEPVRLYIEVADSDGLPIDNAFVFEFWNAASESWDSLAWEIDDQRWAFGPAAGFVIDDDYAAATPIRVNFPNDLYDLVVTVETADRNADPIWTYGLFERQIAVISDAVNLAFEIERGVTAPDQPPRWDYFTATLSNTDGGATPDNIVLFVEVAGTDFGAGDALEFWNGSSWQSFGWDAGREAWFLGRDGVGGVSGFPIAEDELFPIEVRVNFLPDSYAFTVSVESIDDQIVGVGGVYATFAELVDVLPTEATITFNAADLVQTFDGNVKTVGVTTTPEAGLAVDISFDPAPPVNAGSYLVNAVITDPYFVGSAVTSLLIEKGQADVVLGDLSQVYDGGAELPASVNTDPAGLAVTVTYDGTMTVPTDVGSYSVVATVSDANWTGSAAGILQITPATAAVILGDLLQTFDGTARVVSVDTDPAGLNVVVTYDGSQSVPVNAGSYEVVATVVEDNHVGSATATLVVEQAAVIDIQIGNLVQTFDGTPKMVSVITDPAGLGFVVSYDGDAAAPVNAGNYDVLVTIDDQNYVGSDTAVLQIEQAAQAIDFPALPDRAVNDSPFTLAASADSGLAVSFELISGPATVVGDEVTLTGALGEVVIEASQAGDANWLAADSVQRSFQVTEGSADRIEAVSDIEISGVAGQPVDPADLPVVRVVDEFDNPVAGITVSFEIGSGSGSLNGATQVTDGDGLASLGNWTLGSEATQTVLAVAPGLTDSPVTFTADVTPAADLRVSIDDNRATIEVGERNTYVVVVTNAGPNAVGDVGVDVPMPAELDEATAEWSCFPAGGASCQGTGSGAISDTANVPVGSSLVYILQADVLLGPTQTIVKSASLTPPAGVVIVDEDALVDTVTTQVVVTVDGIFRDRFEPGQTDLQAGQTLGGARAELSGFIELPSLDSGLLPAQRLLSARASFDRVVFEITLVGAEDQVWVRLSARGQDDAWQHGPWQPMATSERLLAFDYLAESGLVLLAGDQLEMVLELGQPGRAVHRLVTSPKINVSVDD